MCNAFFKRGVVCGENNIPIRSSLGPAGLVNYSAESSGVLIPNKPGVVGLQNANPEVLKKILKDKIGTCEFYEILSKITLGDRESGYYWNYGRKYCMKFRAMSVNADAKTQRWIDCVTINLQREILDKCLTLGNNLEEIKRIAYDSHASVYTNCGICELDKIFIKQLKVALIPDWEDINSEMGWRQVRTVIGQCIARPYIFSMFVSKYESRGELNEDKLGRDLVKLAMSDPSGNYKLILGVMEMLSNTTEDDDVAMAFMNTLSSSELKKIAETSDGRRILFTMKSTLESGWSSEIEKVQIERIGGLSRR